MRVQGAVVYTPADFKYVATLGYFTPRALPGANVVDASAVAQLLQRGGIYVDTRTEAEFKAGHVPGAVLVPYHEKSAKEADFDGSQDKFDLARLGPDRNAELIFACNGPEAGRASRPRKRHWTPATARSTGSAAAFPSGAAPG